MNITYIIFGNNQAGLINKLQSLDPTIRHVVTIKEFTETRTDLQNRCSHGWYNELAANLKEYDAIGYKCFCKLHFGVPILRTEDEEFRQVYDTAIKKLTYEQKIDVMKYLPVTSLMSTKQLSSYLETMKEYFWQHNGYELKFPSDY
jgi:HD-GYP domain-containing protein (c-di-GMP phosphodiesterase class II)